MRKKKDDIPAWKKYDIENRHKSLEEKRTEQSDQLKDSIKKFKLLFGDIFLSAVKRVEGEELTEAENSVLNPHASSKELIARLKSLRTRFEGVYYDALDEALGKDIIKRKDVVPEEVTERAKALERVMEQAGQSARLPKGFGKWNLKMVKLNESNPAVGEDRWIEFWNLKGESAVGRILYNAEKDLHYFRPYDDASGHTFPLTHDQGRKLTREGRNYYFRKAAEPQVEEK